MNINRKKLELLTASKGITFKELAKLSSMSPQNLSTVKTRGTATARTICKLANALGVDVEELLEVSE